MRWSFTCSSAKRVWASAREARVARLVHRGKERAPATGVERLPG